MSINLSTNIAPDNGQNFWLLDTLFGKGGKVEAPTFADLDLIPLANRKQYMWGVDQSTGTYYEADSSLAWQVLTFGTGDRIFKSVTQTSHGFVKGDVIGYDSNTYVKVLADISDDTDVIGIVSRVVSSNVFEVTYDGSIDLSGIATYASNTIESVPTANTTYLLSSVSPGRLELNEPTNVGNIKKAVLITLSTSLGVVKISTGGIITDSTPGITGYNTVQESGTPVTQRQTINFIGATVTDVGGVTTVTIPSATIADGSITNAKLASMFPNQFKGRISSGFGAVENLDASEARTILAIASGTTNKVAKFNSSSTLSNSSITDTGASVTMSLLAGAGTRMVVADSSGILGTQTIPLTGVSPVQYNSITSFGFGFSTPSFSEPTIVTPNNVFQTIAGNTVVNTSSVSRWFMILGEVSVTSDAVSDDFVLYLIVDGNVVGKTSTRALGWTDGGQLMQVIRFVQLTAGQSINTALSLKSFGIGKRNTPSLVGIAM